MASRKTKKAPQGSQTNQEGITRITVGNFKSIVGEQSIDIKPLTILAGANSSGKSSMMQPLLLLKQTLEAPYDPGALLLDGPNVRFTLSEQLLSHDQDEALDTFSVDLEIATEDDPSGRIVISFTKNDLGKRGFYVSKMFYGFEEENCTLRNVMSENEMEEVILSSLTLTDISVLLSKHKRLRPRFSDSPEDLQTQEVYPMPKFGIGRERCFLTIVPEDSSASLGNYSFPNTGTISENIRRVIHVPGLRGNPERAYPVTAVGSTFPGTFEKYVASIIESWSPTKLQELNMDLARLGLTDRVLADPIDDAQVELVVSRLKTGRGEEDMVNIADVGFGVSQALPVVVALHAAEPGQLVYIEQPEIHLHPRAQVAMAEVIADAARQGKRVVIETHSDLLLSGIQTLVAEGKLAPDLVKLHWFEQLADGSTKITSADLDKAGAFGDWPEDFHNVILAAENRYLNAAEARLMGE